MRTIYMTGTCDESDGGSSRDGRRRRMHRTGSEKEATAVTVANPGPTGPGGARVERRGPHRTAPAGIPSYRWRIVRTHDPEQSIETG